MLSTKRTITLEGYSAIDGTNVVYHKASINSENTANVSFVRTILKSDLYKENREECRADEAEFQDLAYTIQDEASDAAVVDEETEENEG